jgi:hypothetical protein
MPSMTSVSQWEIVPLLWIFYKQLNKRYNHLRTFLKQKKPFPSFHDVHNNLLLEELTLGTKATSSSAIAFAASDRQQERPPPSPAL